MVYDLAKPSSLTGSPVMPRVFNTPELFGMQNEFGYRTAAGCGTLGSRIGLTSVAATGLSGIVCINFFRACKNMPFTRWDMANGTAAGATPTIIRGGLYTVDELYNCTQIAASPNDTTLLSGTNAKFGKAFSAAGELHFGQKYGFAFIWISAASAPTLLGNASAGATTHFAHDTDPKVCATMVGVQTDLPATITAAQINATNVMFWSEIS